jgi:hypothetical protein
LGLLLAELHAGRTFDLSCDEVHAWLRDCKELSVYNENALVDYITTIYERAIDIFPYTGLVILLHASAINHGTLSTHARSKYYIFS